MSPLTGLAVAAVLVAAPAAPQPAPRGVPGQQLAMRCFNYAEKVIGTDRICYYRCGGVTGATYTVKATEICPIFIDN
jgi:hypothetical protein